MVEAGDLVRVDIERIAHGGTCVGHVDGQVVFVGGTLPGERVLARVTDVKKRYARAETVEVEHASPDRVAHVWPAAARLGVGGADLGHVALPAQREWKRTVVVEQLQRLAHIAWDGAVEAVAGDDAAGGLGWRTRIDVVSDDDGRLGMRPARSHRIVPLDDMPLAVAAIESARPFESRYEPGRRYRLLAAAEPAGAAIVDLGPDRSARGGRRRRAAEAASAGAPKPDGAAGEHLTRLSASDQIAQVAGEYRYALAAGGFWQAHRAAPTLASQLVTDAAREAAHAGACVWDLYAGCGLFSVPLAHLVGQAGALRAIEGDLAAAGWAERNLGDLPWARVAARDVTEALTGYGDQGRRGRSLGRRRPDLVVLDPPRAGAGLQAVNRLAAIAPRRIVYVACDPAALARDLGALLPTGYALTSLRAFDLFPHTHHVECVAVLDRE